MTKKERKRYNKRYEKFSREIRGDFERFDFENRNAKKLKWNDGIEMKSWKPSRNSNWR